VDPVLVPVWPTAGQAIGLGRTKTFELIATGQLHSIKIGKRRLVAVEELRAFAARMASESHDAA